MSIRLLSCPLCGAAFSAEPDNQGQTTIKTLRCPANHCFDRAKQGYWNLLAVQQKKSKDPGDNAEMVIARREFLNLQLYHPLAQALSDKLQQLTQQQENAASILDMGCGEGYYTDYCQQQLPQHDFIGLDISKHAVKAATKRNKAITWLVASGANMPIANNSLDIMSVVFSRLMPQAFADKLKPQGTLLLVWPTDQHLIQLKQVIYSEIKSSKYDPAAELDQLFSVQDISLFSFDFEIANAHDLNALLLMTPHGQKVNDQVKASLTKQLPLSLTFSVNIGCFTKL